MQPEIREKLDQYHAILKRWQKTINLVSPKTMDDAWSRHFEDSLQLLPHIPEDTQTLWDLGSGAGFPGLVIAISRPDISVNLIESDTRKSAFLSNVSRETLSGNVHVRNDRLEQILNDLPPPDVMTARAFSSLLKIFTMTQAVWELNENIVFVLPKGRNVSVEIDEAETKFQFDFDEKPSTIDDESCILIVSNLRVL